MKRALALVTLAWLSGACSSDVGGGSNSPPGGAGASGLPDDSSAGASAGGSTAETPSIPPLAIESISPEDGAAEVELDAVIEVRFSAALDAATVSASNVSVQGPSGPIEGELSVEDDVLRFAPAAPLPLLTPVRISLGTGLASRDGAALAEASEARFVSRDGVFREPVQINAGAAASLFLRGNDAGDLIATWADLQVTSSVEAMLFDGEFGTWTPAQPIEDDDQLAFSQPVAGIAPNGDSIVAWRGGGWTRYAGSWSPATVAAGIVFPSLALGADSALAVSNGMEGAAYSLLPNGASEWSEAQSLLPAGRVDAIDTLGDGFIAVGAREGELLAGLLSAPDAGWSEFTPLGTAEQLDRVRLTAQGDAAAVAWVDVREVPATETSELRFVTHPSIRVFADDAWSPAMELPEGAELPWLSVARGGRALAVWAREDAIGVSSFTPDQGWTEPAVLAESHQLGPTGAVDGSGNSMAVWPAREQIIVQRQADGGEWQALDAIDNQVTVALWSHVDLQGRVNLIWQNGSGIWWTRFE